MREHRRHAGRWTVSLALATSLAFSAVSPVLADVNTVNDGPNIKGGIYDSTPDGVTTFINSAHTGLHLKAGDVVTGREVDSNTLLPTGNGGNVLIDASGQVVRLDGDINVSGLFGGHVNINAGALYQNGQIFANGSQGGGLVQMNVASMTMGPNAHIDARGLGGNGGVVGINATGTVTIPQGAVIDSSGSVIGTYNTNVIQVHGGLVNLDGILQAKGLNPGDNGGKVAIYATDSLKIGSTGQVIANGADGSSGFNPGNGGNGGMVLVSANKHLDNDGLIAANGGNGGTNPTTEVGPVSTTVDGAGNTVQQQVSNGQNGGNGGNGGQVEVYFKDQITNNGAIEVKGGNGGDGQVAFAGENYVHQIANGGNGGNGGDGGFVKFFGTPSQAVIDHVNFQGGEGGHGATANVQSACGCATPGVSGACGKPGGYSVTPYSPPPTTPPVTPLYPPYPREYTRLGDTLPGSTTQVLSYNRSIFLARAPLPVIQKKVVPPPPPVVIPPKKVTPKPAPKRVPVRGYW